jgi:hypothetical protein
MELSNSGASNWTVRPRWNEMHGESEQNKQTQVFLVLFSSPPRQADVASSEARRNCRKVGLVSYVRLIYSMRAADLPCLL